MTNVRYLMIMYGFSEMDALTINDSYNELMELTTHDHDIDEFMSVINYAFYG